jgi:hypothetical protein
MSKTVWRVKLAEAKCELEKREIASDDLKQSLKNYLQQSTRVDIGMRRLYELKIIVKDAEVEMQQLEITNCLNKLREFN